MILPIYEHIMQENRELRALVKHLEAELAQLQKETNRESGVANSGDESGKIENP